MADVRAGTILLGHDVGAERRLVALRGLPDIDHGPGGPRLTRQRRLRDRGYAFVTVSELIGHAVERSSAR